MQSRPTARPVDWGDRRMALGPRVSVLLGGDGGRYPAVNSLVIAGAGESVIVDPSVDVVAAGGAHVAIDAVICSHSHEDHLAGNGLFAGSRVHIHHDDALGAHSIDGLMSVYGITGAARERFRATIETEFHYTPRPDATGFADGHVWELGGVRVEAVHLPGHTRGHCGFRISDPAGPPVFYLSDIDLTGFGPYYGDVWSDLDQFEASLERVRDEVAAHYVTSHHRGVIHGRTAFVEQLDAFAAVIARRHAAMLAFLAEPRTLAEMVAHRFVYRPHVDHAFADSVERRTAELHVARMLDRGEAHQVEPGRYRAT